MNESIVLAPWETRGPRLPRPVGLSAHVAAAFADGMIVTLLAVLLVILTAFLDANVISRRTYLPTSIGEMLFWSMCVVYSGSEILFGATPGKWLASVVLRAADGQPAARRRLLLRWAIKNSPMTLMFAAAALRCAAEWASPGVVLPDDAPEFANAAITQQLAAVAALGVAIFTLAALLPSRRTLHDRLAGTNLFHDSEIQRDDDNAPRGFEVQQVQTPLPVDDRIY